MNSIVAAVILAVVVVGAMADYPAPKYEAPKAYGHAAPAHHGGYAAPAPAHHGGYAAPAPAHHGGYAHHSAPVVHAYAAKAPHVKCGANLLVGCAPNVAHVPWHGYGKADHSSCGALLLFDCAPEIVHAPCVHPGHKPPGFCFPPP
uniref:VM domain-containing protein n=1 Tax=Anopheles atroparvus TaxID=41427 RepID=A0AAG5DTZ2_ANOAO